MPIKRWNGTAWVTVAGDAAPGTNGTAGIVKSSTAPADTSVLWADTTVSTNNALIPAGGTTNQALVKSSASDYATTWSTINTNSMTLLSTTTLSGTSTVISGIDQTYPDLCIVVNNPWVNTAAQLRIKPVGSTQVILTGVENAAAYTATGQGFQNQNGSNTLSTVSNPDYYECIIYIKNYASTTNAKPVTWTGYLNGQTLNYAGVIYAIGQGVASITFGTVAGTSTFSGGTVQIYGVK